MTNSNQWYAYLHINGSIHVKRYYDHRDIEEACESNFVQEIDGPFSADNVDEALEHARQQLSMFRS